MKPFLSSFTTDKNSFSNKYLVDEQAYWKEEVDDSNSEKRMQHPLASLEE